MKHEIREVDSTRGIIQITEPSERWYARKLCVGTPQECWDFVPSVSWVCSYYHKGEELMRWIGKRGWDEAEDIKAAAGTKGTKVHQAIGVLVHGGTVLLDDSFENPKTGKSEPLSSEEYFCLMTFRDWFEKTRPEVLASEYTVWNEKKRYAGTVDLKVKIDGIVWIIDIKTSPSIWPSMELQLSAYKHADPTLPRSVKLAIIQVGYRKNKNQKYKFTPVADQFPLFMATRRIWKKETAGVSPFQRDYPLSLSLSPDLTLKDAA